MASKRIDELTNLTSLASDDLLLAYDVSEPSDEKTKKITRTNALANIDAATLGGSSASAFATSGHDHNSAYLSLAGGNLSGDLTVGGNLTVTGTQFIASVEEVQIADNLLLLNKNETGAGVTAGTAGLEIERGTATNYKFLFDEPTDTFRVGMAGSLQAVATREDSPIASGIAIWNDTLKRFDTMESINGMEAHGNEYHTSTFITASDLTGLASTGYVDTASGTLQSQIDNLDLDYATDSEVNTVSGALDSKISAKEDAFSKNNAFNKSFGSSAGDVCQGNDARLSDARTPIAHDHDSRYYTETEVDTISGALNSEISLKLDLTGGNISGDLSVAGNLAVSGTTFTVNTETVIAEDNLILINSGEAGAGVTKIYAGIEVDRGTEENYMFYFDESQDNFRVGVSGSLQAVATRQDSPTTSGVAFWNNSQTRFDTASGFTVQDIATKTYLSSVFSNKYEIFTTSGTTTVTTDFDLAEGAMGVYVDGVRQHNSAFTFSSPRTIILSDTVASGTAIAVIAMEADAVQAMSNKVNTVVSGTTNNLTKLTASGNIADAGVSAASVIEVVNTYGRKNVIINGDTRVWQRGTTAVNIAAGQMAFLSDRFKAVNATDGTLTYTRGTNNAPSTFREYIYLVPTVADTSLSASQAAGLQYIIEGYDVHPLIGKTCTLSFWAYGALAGTYCVGFTNFGGGNTDRSYVAEYTLSAGASFEYKTITFPMHDLLSGSNWNTTNGEGLRIWWGCGAGSNFNTTPNAWQNGNYVSTSNQVNIMANTLYAFAITGVQLEVGSVATQFEYRPFAEELALCQRYFLSTMSCWGVAQGASVADMMISHPTSMRIAPTWGTPSSALTVWDGQVGSFTQSSAAGSIIVSSSVNGSGVRLTNLTGMTTGRFLFLNAGEIRLNAEL